MPSHSVRFALTNGETLTLADGVLLPLYEALWKLAPQPGAASMAAAVLAGSRESAGFGPPIALSVSESGALQAAVAKLRR